MRGWPERSTGLATGQPVQLVCGLAACRMLLARPQQPTPRALDPAVQAVTAREQAAVDTAAARREAALARQQLERLQQEVHVWRLSAASAMGSPRRQLAAGAAAGPWGSPGMEARAVGPAGMGGWGQHAEPAYRQQQAPPSPLVPRHFHEQSAQQASTAHIPAAQQVGGGCLS